MKNKLQSAKRRDFLLAAGVGGAAVIGSVAVTSNPVAQKAIKVAAPNPTGRYQESAHIRDYYDSARI